MINCGIMRVFLSVLILIFSFQSLSKADDISEFEIEGMSIGDSLLNYFSEDEIKKNKQNTQYPKSDKYIISTINNHSRFEIYESVQIDYKKNDSNYVIASIMGMLRFEDNIDVCYKKQKIIASEVEMLFPKAKKKSGKQTKAFDKTGKSTSYLYEFHLSSGDVVQISCDDWSDKMSEKHNLIDHLGVSVMSKELVDFLYDEAY
tara:strand:+ start:58 stop:666 length:609 start_codon:yes stop_codon:yes gene_type:complete